MTRPFLVIYDEKSTWHSQLDIFDLTERPAPAIMAQGIYGKGRDSCHIVWAESEQQIRNAIERGQF